MRRLSTIAHLAPRAAIAVLGATLTLGAASPAHAAPKKAAKAAKGDKKAEAREAYNAGDTAYKAGDYAAAYEGFKKANELIPSPVAEFWMSMAKSYGSDVPGGIAALESVLMSADAEKLGEEKLNMAAARLKELKSTPASVQVTSDPPGAEVSIDGKAQPGVTPVTLTVPPGTHTLGVSLKGFEPYKADFTAKPAGKMDQAATLEKAKPAPIAAAPAKAAPPPKAEEPKPVAPPKAEESSSNLPAYIAIGAGVVGAGIGTFFGVKALSAKSDFNSNPTNDNADRTERNALIADMSFGIALTLGITGVVLLLTGGSDSSEVSAQHHALPHPLRARLDIAPVLTTTTQGAAARVTF